MELHEWNFMAEKFFGNPPSSEYRYSYKPRCNYHGEIMASFDEMYMNENLYTVSKGEGYEVRFTFEGERYFVFIEKTEYSSFLKAMEKIIAQIKDGTIEFNMAEDTCEPVKILRPIYFHDKI